MSGLSLIAGIDAGYITMLALCGVMLLCNLVLLRD